MKSLMRLAAFRSLPLIAALYLTSCNDQAQLVAQTLASGDRSKAQIKKTLGRICPRPLTDDEVNWVADVVEESKSRGVDWLAGRLVFMNKQTRACKGG